MVLQEIGTILTLLGMKTPAKIMNRHNSYSVDTHDWGVVSSNTEDTGNGWDNMDDWGAISTPQAETHNSGWDIPVSDYDTWDTASSVAEKTHEYDSGWDFGIPQDEANLGSWGSPDRGEGKGRTMAKRIIESIKGFIGNPETQDKAKQVARDYGKVALSGAVENAGLYSNGRVRKRGVLKAIFMPKRAARKAIFGATGEVSRKARSDSEHLTTQAKEKLTEEGYRRAGPLGGFAVRGLIKLSPI